MTIDNLKEQWKKSLDEAIESIEHSIVPQPHDDAETKDFRTLANWMLTTPHSPYDFMPSWWQEFRTNPYATDSALAILHHALVDDGDVTFVNLKVETQPIRVFMIFASQHDDGFKELCHKENESLIKSYIQGRESLHRVMTAVSTNHPEKTMDIKPLISQDDFKIESHRNPLQFIKEFDAYQQAAEAKRNEIDNKMAKFRKN